MKTFRKMLATTLLIVMVAVLMPILNPTEVQAGTTPSYLTFTALADNSSVTFGYKTGSNIQYRINNGTWTDYNKGTLVSLSNGDSVSFKGENVVTGAIIEKFEHFSMSGKIAASGDVTSLTNGEGGDATLAEYCYCNMFEGCTALTTAPNLPSTTLAYNCYSNMFVGCTALEAAPALPAKTLADNCYNGMFTGCTALTAAPALPATTLAKSCYSGMFGDCTALEAAPALPAETVVYCCYMNMFNKCTALKAAPALPATTLDTGCYYYMFAGCTALKTAPVLPATTLAQNCYGYMFTGCTALTAPAMMNEVSTLAELCCKNMYGSDISKQGEVRYSGCTNLKIYTSAQSDSGYTKAWKAANTTTGATDWATDMFKGCGATVTVTAGSTYYIFEPNICIGAQTGTLTYGTAGSATYTLTHKGWTPTTHTVNWTTTPTGVTYSVSDGVLTFTVPATTGAGQYPFTVTATEGGNTATASATLTISPKPPTVAVDESLTDKWFKSGEAVTVFGTVTDENGSGIKSVTIAGIGDSPASATVTRQGTTAVYDWTYTYTSPADTTGTALTVTATDNDDLTGTASYTLKVDTVGPTVSLSTDGTYIYVVDGGADVTPPKGPTTKTGDTPTENSTVDGFGLYTFNWAKDLNAKLLMTDDGSGVDRTITYFYRNWDSASSTWGAWSNEESFTSAYDYFGLSTTDDNPAQQYKMTMKDQAGNETTKVFELKQDQTIDGTVTVKVGETAVTANADGNYYVNAGDYTLTYAMTDDKMSDAAYAYTRDGGIGDYAQNALTSSGYTRSISGKANGTTTVHNCIITDAAGNQKVMNVTVVVDTDMPTSSIDATAADYAENKDTYTLNWYRQGTTASTTATASDATGVQITVDGEAKNSGEAVTLDTSAEKDETTRTIVVADKAGNSVSAKFRYAVDGTAPVVSNVAVSNSYTSAANSYWVKKGAAVTVSAAVTDAKSGVKEVKFNTAEVIGTESAYSKAFDTSAEAALSDYTITAKDNVGNEGTTTIQIGVDGTAPVITDNTPDLITPTDKLTLKVNATDASGVKEAKVQIGEGDKTAYTPDSEYTVNANSTITFYFYDNVGSESVKVYTITNIVEIDGKDDEKIENTEAKDNAVQAIKGVNTIVDTNKSFNGDGSGAAGSSSIATVLGSTGFVDVKLIGVSFDTNAASATGTSKIITYTFDVTPYTAAGVEAATPLSNNVTFRLPLLNSDSFAFADVYHEGAFVKQAYVKNIGSAASENAYIEVSAKNYSEYSYTLTNASRVSTYAVAVATADHGTVTASAKNASVGNTVTLTVSPDKGWTLETITAVNASGKEVALTAKTVGEAYTFKMPGGAVTVKATFMEDNTMLNYFVDVTANDYFYDAVLWAAESGITSGMDNLHFSPYGTTTRGQMVTFLWRAAGSPESTSTTCKFTDIAADAYYYKAVLWAVEKGITAGTSETTFEPDATVIRAQTVTFLWRYEGSKTASGKNVFTDVATGDYFYNAVLWAKAQGVTSGVTDTTFAPNDTCIRAQVVSFLYRDLVK